MNRIIRYILLSAALVASVWISQINYLLFHSLIEILCLMVGVAIVTTVYLVEELRERSFFRWLAVIFLFSGIMDLFHTFTYHGMGIFNAGPNLSTTIWILTRLMQSLSLVLLMARPDSMVRDNRYEWIYGILTGSVMAVIFFTAWIPVMFIEGIGLTPLKILMEYGVIVLLLAAAVMLNGKRPFLGEKAVQRIRTALVLLVLSEAAFTLYQDVYGISNLIGHLLKVAGYHYLFLGIYVSGIRSYIVEQIRRDHLTGLTNRKHLENQMQRLDPQRSHVFVLTDLDGLKEINDAHGHSAGDEMIRRFAQLLRRCCRDADTISRIGGDEFGMILHDVGMDDMPQVIQRLETHIRQFNQTHQMIYPLSACYGACAIEGDAPNFHEIYQKADILMYEQKRIKKMNKDISKI